MIDTSYLSVLRLFTILVSSDSAPPPVEKLFVINKIFFFISLISFHCHMIFTLNPFIFLQLREENATQIHYKPDQIYKVL